MRRVRRCCTEGNGSSISPVLPHDGRVHWNLLLFHFLWDVLSQMLCGNTLQFDSVYQRPVRCLAAAVKRHPADSILLLFAFYTYFIYVYAV